MGISLKFKGLLASWGGSALVWGFVLQQLLLFFEYLSTVVFYILALALDIVNWSSFRSVLTLDRFFSNCDETGMSLVVQIDDQSTKTSTCQIKTNWKSKHLQTHCHGAVKLPVGDHPK